MHVGIPYFASVFVLYVDETAGQIIGGIVQSALEYPVEPMIYMIAETATDMRDQGAVIAIGKIVNPRPRRMWRGDYKFGTVSGKISELAMLWTAHKPNLLQYEFSRSSVNFY
jgi:hypothetical protein